MKKWGKITLVIVGALIITALGIDAADTLQGRDGTLLSQVARTTGGGCPVGMAAVSNNQTVTCVDIYESSAGKECPNTKPQNLQGSLQNLESGTCSPESKGGAEPWRFITRDLAMQACAKAGKRLPTSREWYELSLGMGGVEESCNISSNELSMTGSNASCVSPHGTYDMIGNVWEWVADDVTEGMHDGVRLAETGYVAEVNSSGMAILSTSTEQELFNSDYFWSLSTGNFGIIRGGFYGSKSDAGMYAVHADTPPTTAGTGIGFRCVL